MWCAVLYEFGVLGLGLWCLTSLTTIFQLYRGGQFNFYFEFGLLSVFSLCLIIILIQYFFKISNDIILVPKVILS
jgi:hypothetical protein